MTKFRTVIAVSTVAALICTQACAAETALLAPGKPAGVQQAVRHSARLWATIGIAAVVASAVVIAMNNSNDAAPPVATTTTTTP